MVLLRDRAGEPDEIWCRCDHGPHGYLSIASHAHADALSIEVRHGGVDVLADPGTYCYHGEPQWRAYFRSTLGHNTLELSGRDQSASGGPFMWIHHAQARFIRASGLDDGPIAEWSASHNGYETLSPAAIHQRIVKLDRAARCITVEDFVECDGEQACRLAYHLGPTVQCLLENDTAHLSWKVDDQEFAAVLTLPGQLTWTSTRGEVSPPRGWYSPAFGKKVPSVALIGTGAVRANERLLTTLQFKETKA
jgi:uncharacterized heparinase superfamily protein